MIAWLLKKPYEVLWLWLPNFDPYKYTEHLLIINYWALITSVSFIFLILLLVAILTIGVSFVSSYPIFLWVFLCLL